jgi:hypothetical protein
MASGEVYIVDRVVTRPGRAREFIDRYRAEYASGARERGMTLRDVLVSPANAPRYPVTTATDCELLPQVRSYVVTDTVSSTTGRSPWRTASTIESLSAEQARNKFRPEYEAKFSASRRSRHRAEASAFHCTLV